MSEEAVAVGAVVGFAVGLVGLWCGLLVLIGRFGGWGRLAESFPAREITGGVTFKGRSFSIRPITNYNRIVRVTVAEDGILLSLPSWFSLAHPPLFLPWSVVGRTEEKRLMFLTRYLTTIRGAGRTAVLDLPAGARTLIDARAAAGAQGD